LHLISVVLVTGKDVRRRGDADCDRLDIAGVLKNLLVEPCRLDLAATACGGEHGIFANERDQMQAAEDQIGE
jgi:hypothetical protein